MHKLRRKYFLIITLIIVIAAIAIVKAYKVFNLKTENNHSFYPQIEYDGYLNKKTKHGYVFYKFLDKQYSGFSAETICPEGTELPEIDDLTAIYCEAKDSNAHYRIGSTGKSKKCSGYTHNERLASYIETLYDNRQVDFWSSTHYYNNDKDDDGMWALSIFGHRDGMVFVNIPDAEYNVICLGKDKTKQEMPLYKKLGIKKECFDTWQVVVVEGYYSGTPPKDCSEEDYNMFYDYCEKYEDECSNYVGNIIYEINRK